MIHVMGQKLDLSGWAQTRRSVLGGLAGSAVVGFGAPVFGADVANSSNVVRAVEATYDMTVISTGEIFGHEHWSLFVHPDGSRTASVRMINNQYDLFRTIVHRVDAQFRPIECQLLYYRGGKKMGSAWFQVDGGMLHAEANLLTGRLKHAVAVPEHFSMVNHAAAVEGWHFWYCPKDNAPHQATLYNLRVNATSSEGVLGRVHNRTIQYLGTEDKVTPAGTFASDHYAFGDPSRIWVHGEDRMPVHLRFEAADTEFVLSKWQPQT